MYFKGRHGMTIHCGVGICGAYEQIHTTNRDKLLLNAYFALRRRVRPISPKPNRATVTGSETVTFTHCG